MKGTGGATTPDPAGSIPGTPTLDSMRLGYRGGSGSSPPDAGGAGPSGGGGLMR